MARITRIFSWKDFFSKFINYVTALKHFPLRSSPGFSQLRLQHLVDVICSNTAPISGWDCLFQLTRWLNLFISRNAHPGLAPWLRGAQLTALLKPNNGGYRPIAIGDSFCRLVRSLCCSAVHAQLTNLLVPKGQLGMGMKGRLEAAIRCARKALTVIILKIRQTSFGKRNFLVEMLEENCHVSVKIIYF